MATKRDSRTMLQRLADKGYPVDLGALDAPFNLTITSVASIDVDAEPIIKFSQRVKEVVREAAFRCELAGIAVFPMVLNPEIRSTGNTVTWKRGERAYVVRRNIDFSHWQRAKANEKKEMLASCVIDSIASIPMKHLSESSKEALVAIVRQAMRSGRTPRKSGSELQS
jgi:hypothetical protein